MMQDFIKVTLDFMTQFAGGRGGIDHNVVQFGLAGLIWGLLLRVAIVRRREDNPARERLLIWGFSLGLGRELLMFGMAYVFALGLVHHDILHVIFPPLEHALSNLSMFFVAGAFLLFLCKDEQLTRSYLIWSISSIAACYLATFWWWGEYILANPTSKFGQTWCDWLFRINASIWLLAAFGLVYRSERNWLRTVTGFAIGLFFFTEFLKIPDMALGEVYEHNFAPIRHSCYLLGVFLFGYIYLREQAIERRDAKQLIAKLAYHDSLTGLPNRTMLHDRLTQALAQTTRSRAHAALLFLDLDRFKNINDTWGHATGDRLLQSVAERLQSVLREGDTLARLGGDEFVILLPMLSNDNDAVIVAEKILDVMQSSFTVNEQELFTSASVGIAFFPDDGTCGEDLLKQADMAMYVAKDQGRNRYHLFSEEMHQHILKRHAIENDLHKALENNEMVLHYQPQIDTSTGQIHGLEALIRWNHPVQGLLYPDQFIPIAEETGQIHLLGEWVMKSACNQARAWQEKSISPVRIAINISARQFNDPAFLERLDRIRLETNLPANCLELELTESTLMQDSTKSTELLQALKQRGIHLTIDDFGTGYSSLSYLKNFPIDRIKVDHSFIRDIAGNQNDMVIVRTIMAMAENLGVGVVAEGVESLQQLKQLRHMKCDYVQGYFFGRPAPAEDMPWRFSTSPPECSLDAESAPSAVTTIQ